MILKYFIAWFPATLIGIINGSIRVYGYQPFTGELAGHMISTVTFVFLFAFYVWLLEKYLPLKTAGQAITTGTMWLFMTAIFEFIFGHYVVGHPWDHLLSDYNIFKGRLWSFVLLATLLAPYIVGMSANKK